MQTENYTRNQLDGQFRLAVSAKPLLSLAAAPIVTVHAEPFRDLFESRASFVTFRRFLLRPSANCEHLFRSSHLVLLDAMCETSSPSKRQACAALTASSVFKIAWVLYPKTCTSR